MRGQFMFSKSKNRFLGLAVSIAFASAAQVHTVDAAVASINEANLPINVSNQETAKAVSEQNKPANALVSPSRAKAVANTAVQAGSAGQNNSVSAAGNTADAKVSGNSDANAPVSPAQNNAAVSSAAKILLLHSQQCRLLCLSKIRHRQKKILILT